MMELITISVRHVFWLFLDLTLRYVSEPVTTLKLDWGAYGFWTRADIVNQKRSERYWRCRFECFSIPFNGYFRPLIRAVNVPYQAREWPSWISCSMISAFQTGNSSYSNWISFQCVIKHQKYTCTSQLQMSLMPFPVHFYAYAFSSFTPHSFHHTYHSSLVLQGLSKMF